MKRPSFQFYPRDWAANAKLKLCTHAEKGAWIDVLCLLHQSDEYGILRWPLERIARAISCRNGNVSRLAAKQILKGSDTDLVEPLIWTPYHARKAGEPVVLIPATQGPIWFSGRMVIDEYKRQIAGKDTRFTATSPRDGELTSPRGGELTSRRQGDGSASASSSKTKHTPLVAPTLSREATPATSRASGFPEKPEDQNRPEHWQVPSLDDHEGLDRYARQHGVTSSENTYPALFQACVEHQKKLNGAVRARSRVHKDLEAERARQLAEVAARIKH